MVWTKRIDYTLWPIGQGLFTHADIWVSTEPFRVVYDCGTFCSQKQIGGLFFEPMRGRSVDLPVVSHFHWDHISRIPQLLEVVDGIKEVWIPYLSPKQRLLSALTTALGGLASDEETSRLEDVAAMAGSGREWFEARGCRVREVGGPDDSDLPPSDDEPGENPPEHAGEREMERDSPAPNELRLQRPRRLRGWLVPESSIRATQSRMEAIPRQGVLPARKYPPAGPGGAPGAGRRRTPGHPMDWSATKDVLDELSADSPAPLRAALADVLVHQVAHHGAAACLSLKWVEVVRGSISLISAGRSNRFQHPSPEVVLRYNASVVREGSRPFEASVIWR